MEEEASESRFGWNSVIMTVTLLTVTARCWPEERSTFFRRGRAVPWERPLEPPPGPPEPRRLLEPRRPLLGPSCCATSCAFRRGFLVDVPLRTSHMRHLKASAVFRYVQTLQSHTWSSLDGGACRLGRRLGLFFESMA